jgi:hypothetical protein
MVMLEVFLLVVCRTFVLLARTVSLHSADVDAALFNTS